MFQLNGITMQPKIGTNFAAQYGEANSATAASTMANVSSPSAQSYNIDKVTANMDASKLAENLARYDTAQAAPMPKTATREWIA